MVDSALELKANQSTTPTITQVDNILAHKQPTITASTNLNINKMINISWAPPSGFADVHTKANQVYVGHIIGLTATTLSAKVWSPVYVGQGLKIHNSYQLDMSQHYKPTQPPYLKMEASPQKEP